MIPPLALGQSDDGRNMVGWKNTFDMRQVTLVNLAANRLVVGSGDRSHNGCISSPVGSLDVLRKNVQNAINRDIDNVIKKYLEKFFRPAVDNIRNNLGRDSVNDDHIKDACCKILEEAKLMYTRTCSRDSSPYEYSDSETGSRPTASPSFGKRKESDTDSEASVSVHKRFKACGESAKVRRVRHDGPKWNPDRVTSGAVFVIGARANRALGFGQKRSRLYARHPELVRYPADRDDKEWLASRGLMRPTRGKVFLMFLDDVRELSVSDMYKHSPDLRLEELEGFEVPTFVTGKIRLYMENVRSEGKTTSTSVDFDFHASQSMTSPGVVLDSGPSTPSDTLQTLECRSASSKHSDTNPFAHVTDTSPGSNHSFVLGSVGDRIVVSVDPDRGTLSELLASQMAEDATCNYRQNSF